MPTTTDLTRRLARLGPVQSARSVFVVTRGHSDEEIDEAVARQGLSRSDPEIEFKVIVFEFINPDGSIVPPGGDIHISVTDNN